jgi:hypothetical protein
VTVEDSIVPSPRTLLVSAWIATAERRFLLRYNVIDSRSILKLNVQVPIERTVRQRISLIPRPRNFRLPRAIHIERGQPVGSEENVSTSSRFIAIEMLRSDLNTLYNQSQELNMEELEIREYLTRAFKRD